MKRQIMLATVLTCASILTVQAQQTRNPTAGDPGRTGAPMEQRATPPSSNQAGSNQAGSNQAAQGRVSSQTHCWDRTSNQARLKTAGASGGTGSAGAASSTRGSTDRANPSPSASKPPASGTTGSGNTMGLSPC